MKNSYHKTTTIVIIAYKSREKIIKFIKKIPRNIKAIIIDNSNDIKLKKLLVKRKNIKIYLKENNGVSSSINFASKKVKTKYFLQISPDIEINFDDIQIFCNAAKKMKKEFIALGPYFTNVNEKSHKQSNPNISVAIINSIHGSVMFIENKTFKKLKGFDKNFFLYFEETDYCKRGVHSGLNCYQINKIKVKNKGRSVSIKNNKEKKEMKNLLAWHFIWSKFYYTKKHYGYIFSIIYFMPIVLRNILKLGIHYLFGNQGEYQKYKFRFLGITSAILGQKSSLRPKI